MVLLMAVVSAAVGESTVDFDNQIIPVLTKAGCNAGACHGAAVGRGGFKLSLYGGDPEADYRSIVLDLEGRRVNLARPGESLLVLKPTESIDHGGGYRLEYDGDGADLLRKWVEQGTVRAQGKRLERFDVAPQSHVVSHLDATIQLHATAKFSSGSIVDVTAWTVFTSDDTAAAEIDSERATVKLLRRGRHIVVARYLDHVVPIEIIAPLRDETVDLSNEPRQNFIDDHVLARLTTLRLPVSPVAVEATFLRRVTLDLTGRLPALAAILAFQNSPRHHRHERLVDGLLGSEAFNEYWTLQWAKLLRIRSRPGDAQGALAYHEWLKQQVTDRVPYDQFARRILMATGDTHEVGPANFYRTVAGAREQAEFASELFMGNRLRCANCHNHPLDRWTQDDYHGLAAIFARLQRGRVIAVSSRGQVTHPRTGEYAIPRIPGDRFLDSRCDGREAFASWLTDRENPYFAKAVVNRLWKAMMGRGLVEPTDDLRATNPATHPALLDRLAEDFVEHDYDLRHTLRRIALSATYGRSAETLPENRSDDRYYSHALIRPLEAEVLADAISDITGVADQYGDQPLGTRAVTLFDASDSSKALEILGRCSREQSCETPGQSSGGLTLKLHLMNGPLINRKISDPQGRLASVVAAGKLPDQVVDHFYQSALGRRPSPREQEFWSGQWVVENGPRQQQALLEDFLWSLLTCREFVTNH